MSQKILLALVASFDSKGLRISNDGLAKILDIRADSVSKLLSGLESSGDIEIKNRQSRYRAIYFGENSKVKDILLREKVQSKEVLLRDLPQSTLEKTPNITERTKENVHKKSKSPVCETDVSFQSFFEVYPRKENRAGAFREWRKLKPDTGLAQRIIEDVIRRSQTSNWLKEDGKYILLPKNYLRDQRWADELLEPKRGDPGWLPDEAEAEEIMQKAGLLPQAAASVGQIKEKVT